MNAVQEKIDPDMVQAEETHKKCMRCGRALKNPASMKAGYGPICIKLQGVA